MRGVGKVADIYEPDEDADDGDDLCQHVSEVVELALQWCLLADLGGDREVDIADGGLLAGEYNYCASSAVYDGRSLFK